jgi:carbon-monoxide dehydrogenase medium subunit
MLTPRYEAPRTLDDALKLLAADSGAAVLAGGTDLLVQYQAGSRRPTVFVDIKGVSDLRVISVGEETVSIGAAVPAAAIAEHPTIRDLWPGLVEGAQLIGSTQIQSRASLGGNLCNGSPAADSIGPLVANRAVAILVGPEGERQVPMEAFPVSPGRTALRPGELLVAVRLPKPVPHTADAYQRLIPRTEMDIAVASVAVSVTLDDAGVCTAARVALGAVAPTVLLVRDAADALVGSMVDDGALAKAAAAARAAARPIDDKRGTAEYRRIIAGVLTKRVGARAAARAKER